MNILLQTYLWFTFHAFLRARYKHTLTVLIIVCTYSCEFRYLWQILFLHRGNIYSEYLLLQLSKFQLTLGVFPQNKVLQRTMQCQWADLSDCAIYDLQFMTYEVMTATTDFIFLNILLAQKKIEMSKALPIMRPASKTLVINQSVIYRKTMTRKTQLYFTCLRMIDIFV